MAEGYAKAECNKPFVLVVLSQMNEVMKGQEPFNVKRFITAGDGLPELTEDG